jgi:hypothetical protein
MVRPFRIVCESTDATSCYDNSDTHVAADITFSTTYTATMNQTFVDPATGATTNVLTVNPPALAVHVEAGYRL